MSDSAWPPLEELAHEVRLTFHQLRTVAETLHRDAAGLTAGHRGVLESLWRDGPRTVPALARARPVSRQHIQVLVNRLLALGLVAVEDNPAHRRSPLVALTPAGRRRFDAMHRRERRFEESHRLPVSAARLREAAETLRLVRGSLARVGQRRRPRGRLGP